MKYRLLYLLPFLLLLGSLNQVNATHIAGYGNFTYECINNCTLRVTLKVTRDCGGAPSVPTAVNWTGVGTNCTAPTPNTNWSVASVVEITPVSPWTITKCRQATSVIKGFEEITHVRDYNICGLNCSQYTLTWSACCRNGSNNIVNAQSQSIWASFSINTALTPCNSAPTFPGNPLTIICTGKTISNQAAIDLDGDSLVYSLSACRGTSGNTLTYNTGYSVTRPLGPDWLVSIDQNGLMIIEPDTSSSTPGSIQAAVICFKVEEYRNGVKIGEVTRDMMVYTQPGFSCCLSTQFTGLDSVSGGTVSNDTVFVIPGDSVCFNIETDTAVGSNQTSMYWDGSIAGAMFGNTTFSVLDTVQGKGPVGRFCWQTPNANGIHSFWVKVSDTCGCSCQVVGDSMLITIVIEDTVKVWPGDANNDLIANNVDVLALGLAFGSTGPTRPGANITWTGQPASAWFDTIPGPVDKKFTDCNGDGTVNANDTLAIFNNYGLIHTKSSGTQSGPPVFIVMPDSANVGDTLHLPLMLGDSTTPANNIHGIAFSILYDKTLIDSASLSIDFSGSWMGGNLRMVKDFYSNGFVDGAHTRTTKTNVSGMGQIGTIHFILIDNIDGKKLITEALYMEPTNVILIDRNGEMQSAAGVQDSLIVWEEKVITSTTEPNASDLKLWPQPAQQSLNVALPGAKLEACTLYSLEGRVIRSWDLQGAATGKLNTANLPGGIYLLRVQAGEQLIHRRIILK